MNGEARRDAMFTRGAAAWSIWSPTEHDVYVCPLCCRRFGRDDVRPGGRLTEEHAPPRAVGGGVVCLTCRDCNNQAGTQLDAHMERGEILREFFLGRDTRPLRVTYTIAGATLRGEVRNMGTKLFINGVDRINSPDATADMIGALERTVDSGSTDWSYAFTFAEPFSSEAAFVGWLRAAYLVGFAALGYGYVAAPALSLVRWQIANPATRSLRVPEVVEPEADGNRRLVLLLTEPEWGCALMVQIGCHSILLPGVGADESFFDLADGIVRAITESGTTTLNGKLVPWPTRRARYMFDLPE